ncbi:MAG: DHHW family protein [Thermonemataceae bacterium]|nr:DHHW family protein [Thermonemataceae bacterium]
MQAKLLLIRFGTFLFVILLLVLGILFFFLPKKSISDYEKRKLAPFPHFSWKNFWTGEYLDSLDMYVADNFPFRDGFVQTNFTLTQNRGFKSEEVAFYKQEVVTNAGMDKNTKTDSTEAKKSRADEIIEGEADKSPIRGVMIYKGMAIQVFGGGNSTAKYCADVINYYQENLKNKAKVYSVVVPTHGEFYLPHKYRHTSEKKNIDYLYSQLNSEVISVNITETLHEHKDEYIFFNTDHHWTGLGAYYAYQEFCKKANLKAIPLAKMERRVINGFLGSLYWLTRDKRLKENIDSVVYHKIPDTAYKVFSHPKKNPNKRFVGLLYADFAKGPNAYSVYLADDFSLVEVTNPKVKNGRKAMIIKNSFGNAFSPYLVSHFEQVFIVDYRYWDKSLLKMIEENNITDVIIFHYSFSANTAPDLQRIKNLLKDFDKPKTTNTPPKKIKVDSSKKVDTTKIK